ncbi:MAG TPA: hypothetical protein VD927_06365 [Chryseosolibacter sp.]|nr:hypothetical protein [Chryseosolibacter sp.]
MKIAEFEEVIAEAVSTLGYLEDEEIAKNFARQWVYGAKKKLATSDQSIKVCEVPAKALLIKKPTDMKQLIEIALFDSASNFIPHAFHTGNSRIYPNVDQYSYTTAQGTDEETTYYLPVDLSETDTSFTLGTNATEVSYALIRYYPLPIDKDNIPVVYDHEVDAVCAYVRWKWSQRKNQNQSEIRQNKLDFMHECDWAIGKTKSLDFSNEVRKRIAMNFNRQIPNYNRSQF